jgi:hypothetical protein
MPPARAPPGRIFQTFGQNRGHELASGILLPSFFGPGYPSGCPGFYNACIVGRVVSHFTTSYNAAFALLQRRVGDEGNPPVAPSVAASKQKSACIETCFKGTATDGNNA